MSEVVVLVVMLVVVADEEVNKKVNEEMHEESEVVGVLMQVVPRDVNCCVDDC